MPFAVHLAFSLHFHTFLLLLISAELMIPAADRWLGGAGLASPAVLLAIAAGSVFLGYRFALLLITLYTT